MYSIWVYDFTLSFNGSRFDNHFILRAILNISGSKPRGIFSGLSNISLAYKHQNLQFVGKNYLVFLEWC